MAAPKNRRVVREQLLAWSLVVDVLLDEVEERTGDVDTTARACVRAAAALAVAPAWRAPIRQAVRRAVDASLRHMVPDVTDAAARADAAACDLAMAARVASDNPRELDEWLRRLRDRAAWTLVTLRSGSWNRAEATVAATYADALAAARKRLAP